MESPKAMQNIRTGSVVSMSPVEVKESSPDRLPSWKTHTTAPNIAVRLSALSNTAWTGISTLPVSRKTSSSVARTTRARAAGSFCAIAFWASTSTAACPVTEVSKGASTPRTWPTRSWARCPTASPSVTTEKYAYPGRAPELTGPSTRTPGRAASRSR